ncbi:hypothetical protein H5410_050093, partial [Solanum commersonii]
MCIDAWLKLNASCPVCRNSPLPTPMSTPLSEVVPLSQYSDDRSILNGGQDARNKVEMVQTCKDEMHGRSSAE